MDIERADPFDSSLALRAPELLRAFNLAAVLETADVHVARTLGVLAGVDDERVLLAVALAVRAPQMGHVFVDLSTVAEVAALEDVELPELPWPEPGDWLAVVTACSQLVGTGAGLALPLRLEGSRLYLDRYWREERELADALSSLASTPLRQLDLGELGGRIERLFPDDADHLQRAALACATLRGLAVIAGGPGTGKTTTVARLVALLCERAIAAGRPAPLIALCAPTGKAAARMGEAIQDAAGRLPIDDASATALRSVRCSTIHRLLGWLPGGRFRHTSANRLPHDVVIVDETSMVALSLMTRLVGAIRPDAQLVLVGDPDQLTAIEAGAVLRDIVGPAAGGVRFGPGMRSILERVTGSSWELTAGGHGLSSGVGEPPASPTPVSPPPVSPTPVSRPPVSPTPVSRPPVSPTPVSRPPVSPTPARSFGDGVVMLQRGHRFGEAIRTLAEAIRLGDAEAAVAAARDGADVDEPAIQWIVTRPDETAGTASAGNASVSIDAITAVRDPAVSAYGRVRECARAGDGAGALAALASFRLLCAHRRGPHGVSLWAAHIEQWLLDDLGDPIEDGPRSQVGRPLLITRNDHELRLNNGDTGVVVDGLGAVFERDGQLVGFAPSRLGDVEPLYAMTIHKSQGSQFDTAAVVLPEPDSPILTRELLYTAVTRARRHLILIGSEASVRAAAQRPVARATGLRELLWA